MLWITIAFFPHLLFSNVHIVWKNTLFHSVLETVGATIALIMAMMLYMGNHTKNRGKYLLIASAFFTMGMLDGIHSILPPGQGFVFFHSIASLIGGFFIAVLWSVAIQKFTLSHKITFCFFCRSDNHYYGSAATGSKLEHSAGYG